MVYYREFMISGEGDEIAVDSSRDRPKLMLSAPLHIDKFNVKSLEIPLSFNPKLELTEMPFTTTYISGANSATFTDYIAFTQNDQMTGQTIAAKIQQCLVFHTSSIFSGHSSIPKISSLGVSTSGISINGLSTATLLAASPTCTLITTGANSGALDIKFGKVPIVGGFTLTSVVLGFGPRSILSSFMDFTYYSASSDISCTTTDATYIFNTPSAGPTLRTRPSYFFLNSNLRTGTVYHTTARPRETSGSVIAKIHVPMDSSFALGDAYNVWINPSQAVEFMYSTDGASYSELEFWITYPDGKTRVTFIGNAFSLTLATLISDTRS